MRKRYFGDCFSTLLLPPLEQLLLVGKRPLLSLLEKAIPEKLPSTRKRYFGDCFCTLPLPQLEVLLLVVLYLSKGHLISILLPNLT